MSNFASENNLALMSNTNLEECQLWSKLGNPQFPPRKSVLSFLYFETEIFTVVPGPGFLCLVLYLRILNEICRCPRESIVEFGLANTASASNFYACYNATPTGFFIDNVIQSTKILTGDPISSYSCAHTTPLVT